MPAPGLLSTLAICSLIAHGHACREMTLLFCNRYALAIGVIVIVPGVMIPAHVLISNPDGADQAVGQKHVQLVPSTEYV